MPIISTTASSPDVEQPLDRTVSPTPFTTPHHHKSNMSTTTAQLISDGTAVSDGTTKQNGKQTYIWIGLCVCTLVMVGAAVAVAWFMFYNDSVHGDNNEGPNDGLDPRQRALQTIVASVSTPTSLQQSDSPQSQAMHWLLYNDNLWMKYFAGVPTTRIIQRYVLAVFYFATQGNTSWHTSDWLVGEECDIDFWEGVNCNDQDEVRAIAFSKYYLTTR
jgi:hypothetical protein